jgi:Fe-S cluster biosynthesis and repair protein YggX
VKFQRELPGLDEAPFEKMKMIMNEYRLNLGTPEAQEFLLKQMEAYFFGEGAAFPPDFVAPGAKPA